MSTRRTQTRVWRHVGLSAVTIGLALLAAFAFDEKKLAFRVSLATA